MYRNGTCSLLSAGGGMISASLVVPFAKSMSNCFNFSTVVVLASVVSSFGAAFTHSRMGQYNPGTF